MFGSGTGAISSWDDEDYSHNKIKKEDKVIRCGYCPKYIIPCNVS